MRNSNYKYWWKIMHNPLVMIVAVVLLFFLARAAWNMHRSAATVSTKLAQADAELDKLQSEQQNLSSKIDDLSSPSGIESELRTKYRAVKEGESVAVIVSDDSGASASSSGATSTEQRSWFGKMLGWFGF